MRYTMQSVASENEQTLETPIQTNAKNWDDDLQKAIEEGMKAKMSKKKQEESTDNQERLQRIESRVHQLNAKLEELANKYLTDEQNSIRNSIIEHARLGHDKVYINLDREDFVGWHTFVKGGYRNAHPRKCVHLLFRYAQQHGFLPSSISWEVWNNQSFTVVFSIPN